MNTRTLNPKSFLNNLINQLSEVLVDLLIFLFKPMVQFIYKRYRKYKRNNLQKNRTILHNVIVITTVFVLGTMIALSTGLFVKNVNAQDNEILHKYYTSIEVEPGDSLWSIAEEYYALGYDSPSDYIKEVMHINHLKDADEIISGNSLVIPYYSEEIK